MTAGAIWLCSHSVFSTLYATAKLNAAHYPGSITYGAIFLSNFTVQQALNYTDFILDTKRIAPLPGHDRFLDLLIRGCECKENNCIKNIYRKIKQKCWAFLFLAWKMPNDTDWPFFFVYSFHSQCVICTGTSEWT